MPISHVTIVGGGLAGCEAAFQLAVRDVPVTLREMRPATSSPAHHTGNLAELVCSNSLKSDDANTAPGMLKRELSALGSLLLACARASSVPAGAALAVDREGFSALVASSLEDLPALEIVRDEVTELPDGPVILATGPLTSPGFESALSALVGQERLAFFDAAAPIVDAASIDRSRCFAQSRYDKGSGADYLNCPMDRAQYEAFIAALTAAERVGAKEFESRELFQACQPLEEIARRGPDALRFGAFKPVGLTDPATGARPHAVLQLRAENAAATAYNLVGCQTSLTFAEQARVFRSVPGLEHAEFLRYGVVHRNTFVDSPRLLAPDLALRSEPRVRFAGQLTGTEGYLEAVASGLLAALGTYAALRALAAPVLPPESAFGALIAYATDPTTSPYQPMHVNFGLMPPLDPPVRGKRDRHAAFAARGASRLSDWVCARADLDLAHAAHAASQAPGLPATFEGSGTRA